MENYYGNSWEAREAKFKSSGLASAFMRQVFAIMAFGLGITGLAAYVVGSHLLEGEWLFLVQRPLFWVITFSPLAFVLLLSFGINRMSYATASIVFGLYALVTGVGLSPIFVMYTGASIAMTFFISAGMFTGMAVLATVLKVDLTQYRSYFMMALIGLIIVGILNIFLQIPLLSTVAAIVGVIVFCGLTAYDVQKLLQIGVEADVENEGVQKAALMGALSLYLDFINLFLYLLRLLGSRRN